MCDTRQRIIVLSAFASLRAWRLSAYFKNQQAGGELYLFQSFGRQTAEL